MGVGKKLKRLVRRVLAPGAHMPGTDNSEHSFTGRASLERVQIATQDTRALYQSLAMRVAILEKAYADANERLSRYDAPGVFENLKTYSQMKAQYEVVVKQRDELLVERDRLLKNLGG
jgi:hypothetical protein